MPLYEYKCKQCDETMSVTRGFDDPEEEYKCSSCETTMSRVYFSPGVTFKGTGFYSTDK